MAQIKKSFATESEASAFAKGIEFVNDASITILEIAEIDGAWTVSIEDEDSSTDTCEECGVEFPESANSQEGDFHDESCSLHSTDHK